jgi:pseudouridine-5'-phosphate glycosidase
MNAEPGVVQLSPEVADAIDRSAAVVALESTIFSHLGLPAPHNRDALRRCLAAVRAAGAVPAVTAVLDGAPRVGLDDAEHARILGPARKMGERDVAVAVAQGWEFGASTVSAALLLAARAGIAVFATGGIGGVHRGVSGSGDISADLGAIATHPVVTVSAGAKAFLDLPRTLEHLETLGVPVLGYRTDEFPAFTLGSSGLPVPARVDSVDEAAAVVAAHRALGRTGGILLAVPTPAAVALSASTVEQATEDAIRDAAARGIVGAAVTPFILERLADATGGGTLEPNLALAEQNAAIAGVLAVTLAALS